jgi:hypothetical protein
VLDVSPFYEGDPGTQHAFRALLNSETLVTGPKDKFGRRRILTVAVTSASAGLAAALNAE